MHDVLVFMYIFSIVGVAAATVIIWGELREAKKDVKRLEEEIKEQREQKRRCLEQYYRDGDRMEKASKTLRKLLKELEDTDD